MRVCATGHSFGGALAALLILQLALEWTEAPDAGSRARNGDEAGAGVSAGAGVGVDAGARVGVGAGAADDAGLQFGGLLGFTFGLGRLGNDEFARFFRQIDRHGAQPAQPRQLLPPLTLLPWAKAAQPSDRSLALWSLALADDPLADLPPRVLGFADHCARYLILNATRAAEMDTGLGPGLGVGVHQLPMDQLSQTALTTGRPSVGAEAAAAAAPAGTDAAGTTQPTQRDTAAASGSVADWLWQAQLTERAAAWQANFARISSLAWQEVAQVTAGPMHLHFVANYCSALDELVALESGGPAALVPWLASAGRTAKAKAGAVLRSRTPGPRARARARRAKSKAG